MAYEVDRVVICDAYTEPDRHYEILPGGKSKLMEGRRPSKSFIASGKEAKGGIASLVAAGGMNASLFDAGVAASNERLNDFVNELRGKVREWREQDYPGTAIVTHRLLEWWFERDDERTRMGKRFFFCQREAIETVIYLYECQGRRRMPETGDLVRYALKLATGTGKTVVMGLLIVWSTLHKRKVSGSQLSSNFLVLVPNLTVKDRVSGATRGDGLDPAGAHNLYAAFDMVPPEYQDEFHPKVAARNWQGIPLEGKRDDWLPPDVAEEGRFIPASVLRAMRRRAQQDPTTALQREIENVRDLVIINDEAHHAYGEKKGKQGEESAFIKWSKILDRLAKATRVGLVLDLSATPWYGSGSPKPDGTLFEWMVCDFSVYDAFESGLVKVVRLPDPDAQGHIYLDLWSSVKNAKTDQEYIQACKGAIASIYASWRKDYLEWERTFAFERGPSPVLLCVADNGTRAKWLFEHLTRDYDLFRNTGDEQRSWVTLQIDSKVFDADKGSEAVIREMVNTVGSKGAAGERVRCIVSVNMLSEGWDVKSVSHIIGLRAFDSPLLTEQMIGRGLRRTSYDELRQPLDKRGEGADETVDAFGIPFVGFPVQKRKRSRTGPADRKSIPIEPDPTKSAFAMTVPNVRSWAVGVSQSLADGIRVAELPRIEINPKETPSDIWVKPVVGGKPEELLTLEGFRDEYPVIKTAFMLAQELLEVTSQGQAGELGIGPTFEELLDVARRYLDVRVTTKPGSDPRDIGIYYWRMKARDILENAVRNAADAGVRALPIAGKPERLESGLIRRFQWIGEPATGKKCHLSKVPCLNDLEKRFADFLDSAKDVDCYLKNERFGFSVTYYEAHRPRQYFPDFLVRVKQADGREVMWLAETKGEVHPNTGLKSQAAEAWCQKMSTTPYGPWRYLFVPQKRLEAAIRAGLKTFAEMATAMVRAPAEPQLRIASVEDRRAEAEAYKTMLPLYTLKAAAGYFGKAQAVEREAWVEAESVGALDKLMFVVRAKGRSMEPMIYDGDYLVFRAYSPESRKSGSTFGNRKSRIVLAEYQGPMDPETGGSYTVKVYAPQRGAGRTQELRGPIVLSPLNPDYKPIEISEDKADGFRILAEFVGVLGR